MRVMVAGGGVAGAACAVALAKTGARVTVFEAYEAAASGGGGKPAGPGGAGLSGAGGAGVGGGGGAGGRSGAGGAGLSGAGGAGLSGAGGAEAGGPPGSFLSLAANGLRGLEGLGCLDA